MKFKLLRRTNQLTALLFAYTLAVAAYVIPYGWLGAAVLLVAAIGRKATTYYAYGTARWANEQDLESAHMIDWSDK